MNNFINSIARNGLSKNAYLFGLVSVKYFFIAISILAVIYLVKKDSIQKVKSDECL